MELMSSHDGCGSENSSELKLSLTSLSGLAADSSCAERIDPEIIHNIEAIDDDVQFQTELQSLEELHPGDPTIWRMRIRRLLKLKQFHEAVALIDVHDFGGAADGIEMLEKAELLHDAREHERARALFVQ